MQCLCSISKKYRTTPQADIDPQQGLPGCISLFREQRAQPSSAALNTQMNKIMKKCENEWEALRQRKDLDQSGNQEKLNPVYFGAADRWPTNYWFQKASNLFLRSQSVWLLLPVQTLVVSPYLRNLVRDLSSFFPKEYDEHPELRL